MASNRIDLSDALWAKSSYSNGSGGDCVEVASDFPGAALWRKSTYSNDDGGERVEVADGIPGLVPVRDSKISRDGDGDGDGDGPVLLLTARAWVPFVTALGRGGLTV
ncbi:DUF397 domain-containing protein [Streptomyces sp. M92]|uniref:DUF397 domain-containing protein n=1 Tax=Streptomyces sp. M92 TaxID=2944250 RepID=UPI002349B52D|nr:DUF397 domain-containing protein [Streptomyces sp. M92]WCN02926.1 DUF397 domain-containing protein [Streptomyces sp. M92]